MTSAKERWLLETLEKIDAERNRLSQELERLAGQATAFREVLAYVQEHEGESESTGVLAPRQTTPRVQAKSLGNEIWQLLRDEGHPLHYRAIHDKLIERGVQIPGRHPLRNISAHLSNDVRFEAAGGGQWGLKSWRQNSGFQQTPASLQTEHSVADSSAQAENGQSAWPALSSPAELGPIDQHVLEEGGSM